MIECLQIGKTFIRTVKTEIRKEKRDLSHMHCGFQFKGDFCMFDSLYLYVFLLHSLWLFLFDCFVILQFFLLTMFYYFLDAFLLSKERQGMDTNGRGDGGRN